MTIIEAVTAGDAAEFERLLGAVNDVDALDEHGWTLLNWAAGQGRLEMVERLVERGADVFKRGRDNRTPYLVALAAGHVDVVTYLGGVEARRGGDAERVSSRHGELRPYCKAYAIARLRAYPGWDEAEAAKDGRPADDAIVFVHQDLTVTRSALHGRGVIFSSTAAEWRAFCSETLGFALPSDVDLLAQA